MGRAQGRCGEPKALRWIKLRGVEDPWARGRDHQKLNGVAGRMGCRAGTLPGVSD